MASFRDEDVGGFDVSMNNPFGVRGVETIGHINRDGQQPFKVYRTASDDVFEGLAFERFHGDESHTVLFVNLVNGADVGVVQRRGGLRLTLKTS